MRLGMAQPIGISDRRSISEDVVKNIRKEAPMCESQGIISKESLAYLLGWVDLSLPRTARPLLYTCLNYRQKSSIAFTGDAVVPMWEAPARNVVVDLKRDNHFDDSDADECEPLPIALE